MDRYCKGQKNKVKKIFQQNGYKVLVSDMLSYKGALAGPLITTRELSSGSSREVILNVVRPISWIDWAWNDAWNWMTRLVVRKFWLKSFSS